MAKKRKINRNKRERGNSKESSKTLSGGRTGSRKNILGYAEGIINIASGGFGFVRVSEKSEDIFITRGDNNTITDEPISKDKIEGKVIYHSLLLGEIFLRWIKPLLLVLIGILVFIKAIFVLAL